MQAKLLVPGDARTDSLLQATQLLLLDGEGFCQQGFFCVFRPVVMKTLHKELADLAALWSSMLAVIYAAVPSPRAGRSAE